MVFLWAVVRGFAGKDGKIGWKGVWMVWDIGWLRMVTVCYGKSPELTFPYHRDGDQGISGSKKSKHKFARSRW